MYKQRFLFVPLLNLLALLALFGCSGAEDPRGARVAVTGKVSYQGKPLEEGTIQFFPESGDGFQAFGKIVNGTYKISREQGPSVGKQVVKITSRKKTGKMIETEEGKEEVTRQFLPPRYNKNSELTALITEDSHTFDYELE
jgi:hypothetical protein